MKKALIILITLLVLAGLIFSFLYFVWTPENMMSWGSRALADGKPAKAASWYQKAVDRKPENADYVLALTDAHLADNNFTKAERTLVNGIQASPSAALYTKLSSVYVLQDKLRDALALLDSIADPEIRAEIDALRPAAPIPSHESGEYDELISLAMESDAAVYYSLTDDYPSTAKNLYTDPIDLPVGTNRVQAVAVSEDGLVSPLYDGSYRLVGVVQELEFVSPQLEAMIREQLYISSPEPILSNALWDVHELVIPPEVTDFSDLRYFENLTSLTINGSAVEDYSFLSTLFALENLDVSGSYISDEALKYISVLPSLKTLNLSHCGRSDISRLSVASHLEELDLSSNSIQDISPLAGLENLKILNLERNAVTVLDYLADLSSLRELNISKNALSSLSALEKSTGLTKLIADDNQIMDVDVLANMPHLEYFTAANNRIPSVSALAHCTKMTYLDLSNNRLTSVNCVAKMPKLEYLDISNNRIKAVPGMPEDSVLQYFYASYNQIADIDSLAGLPLLAYVDLDYNADLEDISCLASCDTLVKVDAFGTRVKDIDALLEMNVIVNYDPSSVLEEEEESSEESDD